MGYEVLERRQLLAGDLTVQLSTAQINEGALDQPTVTIARTNSTNLAAPLTVSLATSNPAAAVVPASATIPPNATSITVVAELVNNGDIDGVRSATITASAVDYTTATGTLQVTNDDTAQLRTLGGPLAGNLAENSYLVTRNLTVLPATTWTIAPGAALRFNSGTQLLVQGALTAQGSAAKPIVFTSSAASPSPGSWTGIRFDNPAQGMSLVAHAEIAYGIIGVHVQLAGNGVPEITVRQSEIHHHLEEGVNVDMGTSDGVSPTTMQLAGNHIHHNGDAGIEATSFSSGCSSSGSSPLISENEINGNGGAGIHLAASSSSISSCVPKRAATTAPEVTGNYIHHNQVGVFGRSSRDDGFENITRLAPTIQNNLITANFSHGIHVTAPAAAVLAPVVINNTIADNSGTGILHSAFTSAGFRLANNAVTGNQRGIAADAGFSPSADAVEFNNVFGNSAGNWNGYPAAFGAPSTTNARGAAADAEQNIGVPPQYLGGGDYRLQATSLMIGSGTAVGAPASDREQDPRFELPDVGMDEVTPLELSLNVTSISEVGGVAVATVRRNSNTSVPLTVTLFSNDTTEAAVLASITIPAGQDTASFPVQAVEDHLRDGDRPATITAMAAGHSPAMVVVEVLDFNYPPADIVLASKTLPENLDTGDAPAGVSVITAVDDDEASQHVFALAPGGADNDLFQVQGNVLQLRQGVTPDHEKKPSYEVSLQVSDGEHSLTKSFTIFVLDINEPPRDLVLSPGALDENIDTGTGNIPVGVLSASDPDEGALLTFQLVDGEGDADNASFVISDGELLIKQHTLLDFETKPSFQVRIEVSDGELSIAEMLTIQIADLNEPPTDLRLLQNELIEQTPGAVVGAVELDDPDVGDFHTWAVSDERFEVAAGQLKLKNGVSVDFETEAAITLRITAADSGTPPLSIEREFTIVVLDSVEAMHPWHNAILPEDVDGDGIVGVSDLLAIVTQLRERGSPHSLPPILPSPSEPPLYVDVNADDEASLVDLLAVVQYLRERPGQG